MEVLVEAKVLITLFLRNRTLDIQEGLETNKCRPTMLGFGKTARPLTSRTSPLTGALRADQVVTGLPGLLPAG